MSQPRLGHPPLPVAWLWSLYPPAVTSSSAHVSLAGLSPADPSVGPEAPSMMGYSRETGRSALGHQQEPRCQPKAGVGECEGQTP